MSTDPDGAKPGAAPTTETQTEPNPGASPRPRRWRRRAVACLAVLTCFGLFASVVAVWSHRVLFNTDSWIETIGPLSDDPAVTDAVALALTDEIFKLVKPEDLIKEVFPPRADFLAAPMSAALHQFVLEQSKRLLQTQEFKDFWLKANRIIHENAVRLLRGEPVLGFEATNGVVTLNLLPLLSKTMLYITQKVPRIFGEITVPVITMDTPPDQARAELSSAMRVTVPSGFGVYTVLSSDHLAAAQRAVQLFDRLVFAIVLITIALFIATVALSLDRRRSLVVLGGGTILAMVIADAAVKAIQKQVVQLVGGPAARQAAEATISHLIDELRALTNVLLWAGLLLVAVSFLSGDSRLAVTTRNRFARTAGRAPAAVTSARSNALPAIHTHLGLFQIAGVLVAAITLVTIDVTLTSLAVAMGVLGLYELFIWYIGAPSRFEPDDPM